MRTIVTFVAALAAFALLSGCGGKSVVGKWDMAMSSTDPQASAVLAQVGTLKEAMEFKDDGTFTMTVMTNKMEGTYKVEDKTITLAPTGANAAGAPGTLTMSEDGETLTGTEGAVTATLTRSKAASE
jgi:hypothetical protein